MHSGSTRKLKQLDINEDVLDHSFELEQEWHKRAEKSSRPDAAGPALKRLSDAVLKVAGLLAIDATPQGVTPRVTMDHFRQARQLGIRWLDSTLALIEALGRTTFQRDCEAVLSTIRAHPDGLRVRDLYRRHRRLKPRDFHEVLTALERQGEIEIHEDKSKRGPSFQFVIATRR